jgi:hypothetical protein
MFKYTYNTVNVNVTRTNTELKFTQLILIGSLYSVQQADIHQDIWQNCPISL